MNAALLFPIIQIQLTRSILRNWLIGRGLFQVLARNLMGKSELVSDQKSYKFVVTARSQTKLSSPRVKEICFPRTGLLEQIRYRSMADGLRQNTRDS